MSKRSDDWKSKLKFASMTRVNKCDRDTLSDSSPERLSTTRKPRTHFEQIYCGHLKGRPLRRRRKRVSLGDGSEEEQLVSTVSLAIRTPENIALSLDEMILLEAEHHISEYKSTLRHFREKHLDDRKCLICNEDLLHEIHLRRHAQDVHRLNTQRSGCSPVKKRRGA
ncbi:hypothetical protein N7474_010692 [Penicillium riverlandense]|uniref:uncharacterized protein n=1 Tax=Penicillium riverlandense TaxID=1903569 RepID=UPI0025478433|nr:uncharacterized protein N7474_010714 [Penicillium riverlandense]XP_057048373.1 uncharacterized protein N7474_010692 [Penicillium riverlandense]KAJ5804827.1 hypothetical protein N7474_010714 [Penicillium riverlandense]KAJ5807100.1 hypothetical protein N7474_010692 [Penicillium riverlandense]